MVAAGGGSGAGRRKQRWKADASSRTPLLYDRLERRNAAQALREAETVPKTYVGPGNMRHPEPDGGTEPIGQRIIEIPEDSHLAERRDPHSSFIACVPPGSIEAGLELATTGAGRTIQCYICHGDDLKGLGDVPGIAGMSPIYVARQLWDIQYGARTGTSAALMLAVVANLTYDDVISLSAYVASLDP